MAELNIVAILVAGVASFVASAAWYMAVGNAMAGLQREWRGAEPSGRPRPWEMLVLLANQWSSPPWSRSLSILPTSRAGQRPRDSASCCGSASC